MKIKVLWIVNMMLPDLAQKLGVVTSSSGTWMENLSKQVSDDETFDLRIACVYGGSFRQERVGNITYYMLPGDGKTLLFYTNLEKYWDKIEQEFAPDIIHIHGTEYSHSISYLRKYPKKKYLLTIQGIIHKIAPKCDGQLPLRVLLSNRTMRENLHLNGMIEQKLLMKKNAKYEREIIQSVHYATGRTDWDKAYITEVNPKIKYFRSYYSLREDFYHCEKWDISRAEKYKIYASTSAGIPLKGGHIVLKALSIVKQRYPKVKAVFIAPVDENGKLVVKSGYTAYIAKLIQKYGLEDNVEFHSRFNTKQVISMMSTCRLCIVPSAMENASATLREAMDLGLPSIAAFRGGMMELITNGVDGFHYDYPEYGVLAQKIIQLIENDELAKKISENAIQTAAKWHNKENNIAQMKKIYTTIWEEKRC